MTTEKKKHDWLGLISSNATTLFIAWFAFSGQVFETQQTTQSAALETAFKRIEAQDREITNLRNMVVNLQLKEMENFKSYSSRESELDVMKRIMDDMPFPAWAKKLNDNGDLVIVAINQQFTSQYGLTRNQAIGKTDFEITEDQSLAELYVEHDWIAIRSGRPFENTVPYVTSTGETVQMRNVKYKLNFADGSIGSAGIVILPLSN